MRQRQRTVRTALAGFELAAQRTGAAEGEELLQLALTVRQDLLELEEEGDSPALRSAFRSIDAAIAVCRHRLAERRARIAALESLARAEGREPREPPGAR